MYQFSRAIYRELAPHIAPLRADGVEVDAHRIVLRACETAITRMATDRHYFANPARSLFNDIRMHFPISSQQLVHRVVFRYIDLAQRYLVQNPLAAYESVSDVPPQCRATTRKGQACQRTPLPHNGYCPSHQHLAATEDREPLAA